MFLSKSGFAKIAGVSAMSITKACSRGKKPLLPALVGKKIDPEHPAAVAYLEKVTKKKTDAVDSGTSTKADPAVQKAPVKKKTAVPKKKTSVARKVAQAERSVEPVYQEKRPAKYVPHHTYSVDNMLLEMEKFDEEHEKFDAARDFIRKAMIRDLPTDVRELAHMSLNDLVSIFGTAPEFLKWLEATKKIEDISEKRIKNAKTLGELISREVVTSAFLNNIDGAFRSLISDGSKSIERDLRVEFKKDSTPEKCVLKIERILSKFIKMAKGRMSNGLKRISK